MPVNEEIPPTAAIDPTLKLLLPLFSVAHDESTFTQDAPEAAVPPVIATANLPILLPALPSVITAPAEVRTPSPAAIIAWVCVTAPPAWIDTSAPDAEMPFNPSTAPIMIPSVSRYPIAPVPLLDSATVANALLALVREIALEAPLTVARSIRVAAASDPAPLLSVILPVAYKARAFGTVGVTAAVTVTLPAIGDPFAERAPIRSTPVVNRSNSVSDSSNVPVLASVPEPISMFAPTVPGLRLSDPTDVFTDCPIVIRSAIRTRLVAAALVIAALTLIVPVVVAISRRPDALTSRKSSSASVRATVPAVFVPRSIFRLPVSVWTRVTLATLLLLVTLPASAILLVIRLSVVATVATEAHVPAPACVIESA